MPRVRRRPWQFCRPRTPSQAMGRCAYVAGDDGAVLAALADPDVVSARRLGAWTPQALLDI
eukprot:4071618-Alexandrium_andersonii.AAC.1